MFELDILLKEKETQRILDWKPYYQNDDIDMIYRAIDVCNIENKYLKDSHPDIAPYETLSYRILIDGRVFVFIPANDEYKLNCVREHYNTNEKCRPRYTSDEYKNNFYDLGYDKVKKKGRKK